METFMLTFCNATEPGREDEMNNWYTWVHIRDVMSMNESTIAVQRFETTSVQPAGADLRRKYLTLCEVADKAVRGEDRPGGHRADRHRQHPPARGN